MTCLRTDLLQAAGRAIRTRPAVADRVGRFIRAAALPTGGFADRAGRADLYYTVFGLQTLAACEPAAGLSGVPRRAKPEAAGYSQARSASLARQTHAYLETFGPGADLDFVHLCCLARCRALLEANKVPGIFPEKTPGTFFRQALSARLETFRAADGGYNPAPGAACGTAYGAFLALGAWQDLGGAPPEADRLAGSLAGLRAREGGFANSPAADVGLVPASAAALVTLAGLGEPIDRAAVDWLLGQVLPSGGWPAAPGLPAADLLSTATALHALAAAGATFEAVREPCLAFVEGLAAEDGGFRGHLDDTLTDCEYTFYGLLALGHLV